MNPHFLLFLEAASIAFFTPYPAALPTAPNAAALLAAMAAGNKAKRGNNPPF